MFSAQIKYQSGTWVIVATTATRAEAARAAAQAARTPDDYGETPNHIRVIECAAA